MRQGINIFKKIKLVLTMSVLIILRITGYHSIILTIWLLLFFPDKNSKSKLFKKLILFLFLKIKKSLSMLPTFFRKRKGNQGKVTSEATSKL